ncbi:MAG: VOC family protein [Methylacidiphilales bacterium]|nr:VOC family protein [Candidatus Methylacidiphilales bacterium]
MQLNPYLMYNGQCEAAFKFYERCLGGKIVFKLTNGESPMAKETPPERLNHILHARFQVGDLVLMGSDSPPERFQKPQGFAVSLGIEKPQDAERVYQALAENATIMMPLQETFWALRFGMLVDQFGIPWMINCEKTS